MVETQVEVEVPKKKNTLNYSLKLVVPIAFNLLYILSCHNSPNLFSNLSNNEVM